MKPEEFKPAWSSSENNLTPISKFNFNHETEYFLLYSGLPKEAAPFLDFYQTPEEIRNIQDLFSFLNISYSRYIHIGSTGSGNSIVINTTKNDCIECLNHQNNFSPIFVNTSINTLAACLLAYRNFVETVQRENGEDAFINSNFTDAQFEKLKSDITSADINIINTSGFWMDQLQEELSNREHEKNS